MADIKKISHKTFEIRNVTHVWIEDYGNHYALMQKIDGVGSAPVMIAEHPTLIHAIAHQNAVFAIMRPNIVEGSEKDVTEFDNSLGKRSGNEKATNQ